MGAIDWVMGKAVSVGVDRLTITSSDTDNAEEVGEYEVETSRFCGRVSYRMARELLSAKTVSTAETRRTILVCLKTNTVEFFRTDYRKVAQ